MRCLVNYREEPPSARSGRTTSQNHMAAKEFLGASTSPAALLEYMVHMASKRNSAANASPAVIQEYFEAILVQNHDVSQSEAQEVARKWQYGRGTELRDFDIHTYRGIFGFEVGALFWAYAHGRLDSPVPIPAGAVNYRRVDPAVPGKQVTLTQP
jgi:hypothetical protein